MSTISSITTPLAQIFRPTTLNDVVGQSAIEQVKAVADTELSLLFYGPPGCGKTTTAGIIAAEQRRALIAVNGTDLSMPDLKKRIKTAGTSNPSDPDGPAPLVYLDEIHYLNTKQQDVLLPMIENGTIRLIASTAENPWHSLNKALISRLCVIQFMPVDAAAMSQALIDCGNQVGLDVCKTAANRISELSGGDMRRALNILQMAATTPINNEPVSSTITQLNVDNVVSRDMPQGPTDVHGDSHYTLISALHKSIRGSDPDAAVFYLMRLIDAGDIEAPMRRLPVIACEDIGLADPNAIVLTHACIETARRLGLPEATKPLVEATIYLACALKSSSNEATSDAALADIKQGLGRVTPSYIASEHAPGYVWPQDRPRHWADQQYLPDDIATHRYYIPGDNPTEQQMCKRLDAVRTLIDKSQMTDHPRP